MKFQADSMAADSFPAIRWRAVLLAAAVFVCMKWTPLKKLHPILFIAAAAVVGIVFQF